MKTNQIYFLLSTFIIILISITLTSRVTIKPYYAYNLFKQHSAYEGFGDIGYSSINNHIAIDKNDDTLINRPGLEYTKVKGFNGLYGNPNIKHNKLDLYNDAQGTLDCNGSGLTNSKGSLCLDKTMKTMLQTRGGNASGVSSQIGQ
jgi:hypothetical protein